MNLEEIKKWLEDNKNDESVKTFLGGLKQLTKEDVEGFLEKEEGKRVLQPKLDQYFTKGLDTWKANNLQSLIDEKLKELNPDKSPQDIELEKIRKQLADMEREKLRESLKNKALTVATEKGIPTAALDYFLGEDEETTLQNLEKYESDLKTFGQQMVEKSMKKNEYTPPGGAGAEDNGTGSRFAKAANDSQKTVENKIWK